MPEAAERAMKELVEIREAQRQIQGKIEDLKERAGRSSVGRLLAVAATKSEDLQAWLSWISPEVYTLGESVPEEGGPG